MLREKGKEWDHVTIIELKDRTHQHKVECKFCKRVFVADTSRIREHFLHINPTCGVAKCTADEPVLQPVLEEMGAIDAQNEAAAAAAAAAAATPTRQKYSSKCEHLLGTCKEAADAWGVQGSRLGLAATHLTACRASSHRTHLPDSSPLDHNFMQVQLKSWKVAGLERVRESAIFLPN